MKWFYNKDKESVLAAEQPDGYHYDFRGNDLSPQDDLTEAEIEKQIELEDARSAYMKKFGKMPSKKSKLKTLLKALADDS